jgi:LAO/AO transport system kinase
MTETHARLLADFDARRPAALARAVSIVENHRDGFDHVLARLHPRLGRALASRVRRVPASRRSRRGSSPPIEWRT